MARKLTSQILCKNWSTKLEKVCSYRYDFLVAANHVDKFLEEISDVSEGIIAFANLADFKRRNQHLGYEGGNKEIVEFDSIAQTLVRDVEGKVKRVSGDGWLIFLPHIQNLSLLQELIDRFYCKREIEIGWRCEATISGLSKRAEEKRIGTMIRGVRLGFSQFHSSNLQTRTHLLIDNIYRAEINQPLELDSFLTREIITRWKCIDCDFPEYFCPHCNLKKFEWTGGADDASEGNCNGCGAEVNFSNF